MRLVLFSLLYVLLVGGCAPTADRYSSADESVPVCIRIAQLDRRYSDFLYRCVDEQAKIVCYGGWANETGWSCLPLDQTALGY